ncbi:MAG: hypothetical protein AAF690_14420 [Acidobacteriota bacterium]
MRERRIELGRQDVLTLQTDGSRTPEGELAVRARFETPIERSWTIRTEGRHHRPTSPGTPVYFHDRFFEVLEHRATSSGHVYLLENWDPDFGMSGPAELSEATVRVAYEQYADAVRREQARPLLAALSPLLGMLPADWQFELEERYDFVPERATAISGLLLTTLNVALALYCFWQLVHQAKAPVTLPLHLYLIGESLLRWACGFLLRQPLGSLPVVLVARVAEAFRPARVLQAVKTVERPDLTDDHVVIDQHEEVPRVLIETERAKADWLLNRTGIEWSDRLWVPVVHESDPESGVHRYELEPHEEGDLMVQRLVYDPREARLRRDLEELTRDRTLIETITPALGLLDAERKERLSALHELDVNGSTRTSIAITAVFAMLLASMAFVYLNTGEGDGWDVLALMAGVLGLLDVGRRQLLFGKVVGSPLGIPLRGFADQAIRRGERARQLSIRCWGKEGPRRMDLALAAVSGA